MAQKNPFSFHRHLLCGCQVLRLGASEEKDPLYPQETPHPGGMTDFLSTQIRKVHVSPIPWVPGHITGASGNYWLAGARVSQRASLNDQTVSSEQAWEPWELEGGGPFP